jgi:hypothetical protein
MVTNNQGVGAYYSYVDALAADTPDDDIEVLADSI